MSANTYKSAYGVGRGPTRTNWPPVWLAAPVELSPKRDIVAASTVVDAAPDDHLRPDTPLERAQCLRRQAEIAFGILDVMDDGPERDSLCEYANRTAEASDEIFLAIEEQRQSPPPDDWDWFDHLTPGDRQHLQGPHRHPAPCPWCGGRSKHNPTCIALTVGFFPAFEVGKHVGKPLSDVPDGYLRWAISAMSSMAPELHAAVADELRTRGIRFISARELLTDEA